MILIAIVMFIIYTKQKNIEKDTAQKLLEEFEEEKNEQDTTITP